MTHCRSIVGESLLLLVGESTQFTGKNSRAYPSTTVCLTCPFVFGCDLSVPLTCPFILAWNRSGPVWSGLVWYERSRVVQNTAIEQSLDLSMTDQTVRWPFLYDVTVRWLVKPLEDRSFCIHSVCLRLGPFRSFDRSVDFCSEPVPCSVRSNTVL